MRCHLVAPWRSEHKHTAAGMLCLGFVGYIWPTAQCRTVRRAPRGSSNSAAGKQWQHYLLPPAAKFLHRWWALGVNSMAPCARLCAWDWGSPRLCLGSMEVQCRQCEVGSGWMRPADRSCDLWDQKREHLCVSVYLQCFMPVLLHVCIAASWAVRLGPAKLT